MGAPAIDGGPWPPARRAPVPVSQLLLVLAMLLWSSLAGLVYLVSPVAPAALAAFFLGLFCAIFCTLAPVIRLVSARLSRSRLYQQASAVHSTRQALMVAAFVVLNAMLQMLRVWTGLTALLLFGMFAVIEVVALARR